MGRFLTNREMYFYCNDCSLVKSHKLGGVIEKRCLSLEFMGDLEEPDSEVSRGKNFRISKKDRRTHKFGIHRKTVWVIGCLRYYRCGNQSQSDSRLERAG